MIYDAQVMLQACRNTQGRGRVLKSLRFFRSFYEDNSRVYNAAILREPEEHRNIMHDKAITAKPSAASPPDMRKNVLMKRKRARGQLSFEKTKKYGRQMIA